MHQGSRYIDHGTGGLGSIAPPEANAMSYVTEN